MASPSTPIAGSAVVLTLAQAINEAVQITVTDICGRAVLQQTSRFSGKQLSLDMKHLTPGVYLIRLNSASTNLKAKLVKQ